MTRKRKVTEAGAPKVPAYIVTFSDMVTLLLTFFVMLLSLANVQDPELFNTGRDSFLRSIRGLGLGLLLGREQTVNLEDVKRKYLINNPDNSSKDRTIDTSEERIRRLFEKVRQSMKTLPSQIVGEKTDFSITNIHFSPGCSVLNEPARGFLGKFCLDLQQVPASGGIKLCVLGLASDGKTEKEQWVLSAKRAEAVAGLLRDTLPSELKWPVYSWGAGPGGDWVGQDSPISGQSQILIALLRENG